MQDCKFRNYLTTNADIDISLMESCLSLQRLKHFDKNDFIVREGELCQYTYFVEKGLLRLYSIDKRGREHLLQFAPEGWFISDHGNMYSNQPSSFFIQALEPSTVYQISDDFFDQLGRKSPEFSQFNTKLLHNHISGLQKRILQLISNTAEERYLSFVEMYPDILLRVPQTMVASYLGIAPESLSRIRRELAERNFKQNSKVN